MSKAVPLIVQRTIAAPCERLFSAFSTAEKLAQWFVPSPDVQVNVLAYDFKEGGGFRLRYDIGEPRRPVVAGVFEAIDRPNRIAFTWVWQAPDPLEDVPMTVVFDFKPNSGCTDVVVTHHGIPSDGACTVHEAGWKGTLARLEARMM